MSKTPLETNHTVFSALLQKIKEAQQKAYAQVNNTLIQLYWEVGKALSQKVDAEEWGKSVVKELAIYIRQKEPSIREFSDKNLWRMKQFYETYKNDKKLSALVRELPWTHNTIIFSRCNTKDERLFYLNLCNQERYSSRALERQINAALFERTSTQNPKLSAELREIHPKAKHIFKDNYTLEFLGLHESHNENELQKSIIRNMKQFILELGKDFIFIDEEYKLQVGNQDFFIDLLFFHRELSALVAFELKIGKFLPQHLGQLNFYLEALDRDIKKEHENPSIGVLMCSHKDDEVVKYALSRNISPTLISQYQLKLPDKKLLQSKLQELLEQTPLNDSEN